MAGIFKAPGAFTITPHRVSVCIMLQVYAPLAQISLPFPFTSVSKHNRFGVFLLALTKSCDDILEPTLDELIGQLRETGVYLNQWLTNHLTSRLSSLSSPDDSFNFFSDLQGILGGPDTSIIDDDQINLDPSSNLGIYLRCCLLAFNIMSFEAAAVAQTLFCMCYKFNLQVENAAVLLFLAEIHKRSGNAALGIPYALASLSFCQLFNLDLLKASATLSLVELWLSLGSNHTKQALTLVHGALPIILGHGGLELRGGAYIAEVKCYLSDPSFPVFDDSEAVLDPVRQASEEFEVLEYHELVAEAFYLMAIVFDKLEQLEEREEAAASFKKHILALENPIDKTLSSICCK